MIHFRCEHCGQSFSLKDELAGKKGNCPKCKQFVQIPQEEVDLPEAEIIEEPPKQDEAMESLLSAIQVTVRQRISNPQTDALAELAAEGPQPVPLAPPVVCCPMCRSTSLTVNNKGFSLGKAAVGFVLLGPLGTLGGLHKSNKVKIRCLNCGHEWVPGR